MREGQMFAGCMLLAASLAIGQTNGASPENGLKGSTPGKAQTTNPSRGEQVFHENCYRCHQEPEGFSPSISGTIAKHMRVRAGLSDDDVKALLKFLNP